MECKFDGCGDEKKSLGYCQRHYQRQWRYGDPSLGGPPKPRRVPGAICSVRLCDQLQRHLDLCSMHYKRKLRYGDVLPDKPPSAKRVWGSTGDLKETQRWSRYRLEGAQYDAILEAQGGVCAGCHQPFGDSPPCVDHDHSCCPGDRSCGDCVRGILHRECNTAAGMLGDDPEKLRAIADYLVRTTKGRTL